MTQTDPSFAEGMKETWKGHVVLHSAIAVLLTVVTALTYALGFTQWVLGVFFFAVVVVGFIFMSGAAVFWIAVDRLTPTTVKQRLVNLAERNLTASRIAVFSGFLIPYIVVVGLAVAWPADSAVEITVAGTESELSFRRLFQGFSVLLTIALASMLRDIW